MLGLGFGEHLGQTRLDTAAHPGERIAYCRTINENGRLVYVREAVVVVRRFVEAVESQDFLDGAVPGIAWAENVNRRPLLLANVSILDRERQLADVNEVERIPVGGSTLKASLIRHLRLLRHWQPWTRYHRRHVTVKLAATKQIESHDC